MRITRVLAVVLAVASAACGSRTGLDVSILSFDETGDGGRGSRTGDASGSPDFDSADGSFGDSPAGSDAMVRCAAGSLLPGGANPTWAISVQPDMTTILNSAYAVEVAADGAIFAVGCGEPEGLEQPEYTSGSGACFLIKLDTNGRPLFIDYFVNDLNDPLSVGLADDHAGGVLLGLRYDGETDLGGDSEPAGCGVEHLNACGQSVWATTVTQLDCSTYFAYTATKGNESALTGACYGGCDGGSVVARLDPNGSVTSMRTLAGAAVYALAMQTDGTLFVGGYGQGQVDFGSGSQDLGTGGSVFFATYDEGMSLQNFLAESDNGAEMQAAATADGSGFIVAGVLNQYGVDLGGGPLDYSGPTATGAGNQDIFVARVTKELGWVYGQGYGDTSEQDTSSICVDSDGTVSWAGICGAETSFGGMVISGDPTMGADGFLARFSPGGMPESVVETPSGVRSLACTGDGYAIGGDTPYPADLGAGTVPQGGYIVKRKRP
jgi:hypothetical protein